MKNLLIISIFVITAMSFVDKTQNPHRPIRYLELPEGIGKVKHGDTLEFAIGDTVAILSKYKGVGKYFIIK